MVLYESFRTLLAKGVLVMVVFDGFLTLPNREETPTFFESSPPIAHLIAHLN